MEVFGDLMDPEILLISDAEKYGEICEHVSQ